MNADVILIALASGITGIVIGAFLMFRGIHPKSRQQLEARLQDAERKLQQQNAQITEHFTHTASLVSNLTRNYRDLHDYLSSSAQQLGNIDIQPVLLSDSKSAPILGQGVVINPPLDYALKKSDVGTLSEVYGLKDEAPKPDAYEK
ncbi:MAG TPA: DUF1043 family protein [Pseudomonadales bacterium]|nr:DUF1043 family protein [Pseudomonadales bacterium]